MSLPPRPESFAHGPVDFPDAPFDASVGLDRAPPFGRVRRQARDRTVAVGMAEGPAAGLAILDAVSGDAGLKNYHLLLSVRAELLCKLARFDEARAEFQRAAALTQNTRECDLLLSRAHCELARATPSPPPPGDLVGTPAKHRR